MEGNYKSVRNSDAERYQRFPDVELREVERLESPDIRAGMALVSAALCAQGQSIIRNIGQIDRGYEHIEEKLQALGADIVREQNNKH